MTIRYTNYTPNSILYAEDIQGTANNGIVEISALNELTSVDAEVNMVFCKQDYNIYKRIAEGVGGEGVVWEVF
jgi:hypothetical protein